MKKKLIVLTGAGISAESGIQTFRGNDGLWNGYDIMEVASPQGWEKNKALVLDFYNQRRQGVRNAKPNVAHHSLKELESDFDVHIITQNIDDLHERANSKNILHLHGEIMKARSEVNEHDIILMQEHDIQIGDLCKAGFQLRPFIVWFGEAVPVFEDAVEIVRSADILVIIGTSLQVYPAASLYNYVSKEIPIYLIDPSLPNLHLPDNVIYIQDVATKGCKKLINLLKTRR